MSKDHNPPYKTPKKLEVKIAGKDEKIDFQKKLFGDSCKKLIEGFVAGHVQYPELLANFGMYAEAYCMAVGREQETTLIEFSDETEEFEEEDDDFYEKEYPATQPYGD